MKPVHHTTSTSSLDLRHRILEFWSSIRRSTTKQPFNTVLNIDETSIQFEHVPQTVLAEKGHAVIVACNKNVRTTATAVLATTLTGQLLPPTIIFRGKNCLKVHRPTPPSALPAFIFFQKNGWMDGNIWTQLLQLLLPPLPKPLLFIFDNFKAHNTAAAQQLYADFGVTALEVPAHCTPFVQPTDANVHHLFKTYLYAELAKRDTHVGAGLQRDIVLACVEAAATKLQSKADSIQRSFVVTGVAAGTHLWL